MPASHRKVVFLSALAFFCAGTLWLSYDWFESRYIRAFSEHATLFQGDALKLPDALAGPGPIRLVHFWDPACPCNVANQQHLSELEANFTARGVSFYSVQKPDSNGQLPANLGSFKRLASLVGSQEIPASPAVAIFDQKGQLAYFGPYSEGATCNSSNSFIEPVLNALLAGRKVDATHTLAVGCYCPWAEK
ncbi:DUF6436 domain-containing protein [Pseudomonas sp.]|uniref:DUF6436 domain-containing protein n=1 Tax=Pseudomonas sp. TaxID=306 RepID=UPI003CC6A767